MKKQCIGLLIVAAACAAQAQSKDFAGFSAGANLAMNAGSFSTNDGTSLRDGYGQQSVGVGGFAAYGLSLGSNSLLTLGFDYAFSDVKAGEFKNDGVTYKLQNLWSLSIAPGTLLNDKTMAYFKLGFENGRAVSSSGSELTKNITGSSWGLGLKTLMDKNTYVQVEVKQANFGTARMDGTSTDFTARGTAGSVGVGFMF